MTIARKELVDVSVTRWYHCLHALCPVRCSCSVRACSISSWSTISGGSLGRDMQTPELNRRKGFCRFRRLVLGANRAFFCRFRASASFLGNGWLR